MNNGKKTRNKDGGGDEVEEMLQAAQDELLLKMSVDSHISRVSPDYLLPDLDRRFQALKSRPSKSSNQSTTAKPQSQPQPQPPANGYDDLLTRFAALKASSSVAVVDADSGEDEDEEDEVEKIIRWAKDAARLDPSPPSDDDERDAVNKRT